MTIGAENDVPKQGRKIKMPVGRPKFEFCLIDLPSDHEIDGGLITECQMINALLHNNRLGTRTKVLRGTTKESLNQIKRQYHGFRFVHLSTHGTDHGITLLGDSISWEEVASMLIELAPVLDEGVKRTICLSCCHSSSGLHKMRSRLRGHFTSAFGFYDETIPFSTAMTVWAMFYNRETIRKSPKEVLKSVNDFFGKKKTLAYADIAPTKD